MQKNARLSSKDRIIETANDLFYRQGYHQTGINQIIEESGVAKATFYSNFKSKEDLGVEYLRERDRIDTNATKNTLNGITDPHERYMSIINGLLRYMKDTDFRGCAFGNMAVEITDPNHPMRKEVKLHDDRFRSILKDVIQDLKDSNPKYKQLDVDQLVDTYHLLVEGAVVASKNYNDTWPIERAVKLIEKLVK
ncbi:MAG: TetR family transcriptional regulator [Thermodesulfobacteriota bacterium]|nr:MAG: TetR family transcriptional regulator [Thermodesulfobacteriota bacterium]